MGGSNQVPATQDTCAAGTVKSIVTASLDTGPLYVNKLNGLAAEPTLANADVALAAFRARACSGCGRLNAPLTRWPVAALLGSATDSVASPAVDTTFAVVEA